MTPPAIVLTGSQSGMGLSMREYFDSREGIRLIGVDLPDKGAEVDADRSSPAGCRVAVEQVLARAGGSISGVIANAGVVADNPAWSFRVNYFCLEFDRDYSQHSDGTR